MIKHAVLGRDQVGLSRDKSLAYDGLCDRGYSQNLGQKTHRAPGPTVSMGSGRQATVLVSTTAASSRFRGHRSPYRIAYCSMLKDLSLWHCNHGTTHRPLYFSSG